MPQALIYRDIACPYCYSVNAVEIDISAGFDNYDYYEDCQACCSPMELSVNVDDQGEVTSVEVKRGNG